MKTKKRAWKPQLLVLAPFAAFLLGGVIILLLPRLFYSQFDPDWGTTSASTTLSDFSSGLLIPTMLFATSLSGSSAWIITFFYQRQWIHHLFPHNTDTRKWILRSLHGEVILGIGGMVSLVLMVLITLSIHRDGHIVASYFFFTLYAVAFPLNHFATGRWRKKLSPEAFAPMRRMHMLRGFIAATLPALSLFYLYLFLDKQSVTLVSQNTIYHIYVVTEHWIILSYIVFGLAYIPELLFCPPPAPKEECIGTNERPHHIITGGSSGIGLALARQLLQQGAHLTLMARNEEKLAHAREDLLPLRVSAQQQILTFSVDLSHQAAAAEAMQQAIAQLGPPEWLFLNAGIARPGYVEELSLEIFHHTMACNYFGSLHPLLAALPHMRKRGRGRIIFTSSGAGLIGIFGYSAYTPSKFAQRGLAEVLWLELRRFGIGVSIVYPPDTDTPQLAEEQPFKPWQTQRIAGTAGVWQADDVARTILAGIDKGHFAITPGITLTLLSTLHSVIAPLLRNFFAFQIRKP